MKENVGFVDCKAIEKSLKDNLPSVVKVVRVWEGTMRGDNTIKVYVVARLERNDLYPPFFSEISLADMRAICGELIDIEIKDAKTLEFGFALPITSHYYLHK